MDQQLLLCRALNTHAWQIEGPIVILKNEARRVTLMCARCSTVRVDVWHKTAGSIQKRLYHYEKAYRAMIDEHDRAGARMAILAGTKEVQNESNDSTVRSVRGSKGSDEAKPKEARRHNPRVKRRPRDKKKRFTPTRRVRGAQAQRN